MRSAAKVARREIRLIPVFKHLARRLLIQASPREDEDPGVPFEDIWAKLIRRPGGGCQRVEPMTPRRPRVRRPRPRRSQGEGQAAQDEAGRDTIPAESSSS